MRRQIKRLMGHLTSHDSSAPVRPRLVDVTSKSPTARLAVAEATLLVASAAGPPSAWWPAAGSSAETALMATASVAGVGAAKRTSSLIPLCHPLPLDGADVAVGRPAAAAAGGWGVTVTASVRTTQRTGVEMEALAAAAVGALTLYDMLKGGVAQQCLEVGGVRVLKKSGGKRDFAR